ncbi:MAG: plasmid pRiA4b ORF-3 family protein [Candidatus Competibacteraceae bacterium]|nr:plasmid pRiA4b ORF-3 family protein [Candidatus Competibacteraceae bacterium]
MSEPISKLPPYDCKILQAQTITEDSPGPIVRDFATLLAFIGADGIEVSGKYRFLPMARLAELNARLSRPIKLDLKRPQQKSYPSIHGLYLLLRASGLGQVRRYGKKDRLILDAVALECWESLNLTERYFALLETWLLRGDTSILGERGYGASGSIHNWPVFCQRSKDRVLSVAGDRNVEQWLPYTPTLCTLALLDLFGMVILQQAKSMPGKGWQIARIERTDFGEAMLHLLFENELFFDFFVPGTDEQNDEPAVRLHTALQPFFPDLQHRLQLSSPEGIAGIYVFKVALGSVWARIAIPSDCVLEELSQAILSAFQFDSDHLYCFTYTNLFCSTHDINHPYMD